MKKLKDWRSLGLNLKRIELIFQHEYSRGEGDRLEKLRAEPVAD